MGLNELELSYTHAHIDASIDAELLVGGAHFELNEAAVTYTHYYALLDHLAWVEASSRSCTPITRRCCRASSTRSSGRLFGA